MCGRDREIDLHVYVFRYIFSVSDVLCRVVSRIVLQLLKCYTGARGLKRVATQQRLRVPRLKLYTDCGTLINIGTQPVLRQMPGRGELARRSSEARRLGIKINP